MKKALIRTLAIVLTVIMILTVIPMNVFAKENEPQEIAESNTASLTATDDFSRIVMSKVEAENENKELYGITEITIKNKTASVHLAAPDNCTLVVAVYSEEMQMLGYGITDVNSEQSDYTVTLSSFSFPKYYIVKGFILDENKAAVCDEYVSREYTKAYEEFMDLTTDDFDSDYVLNYDTDKTNNFAVLREDVIVANRSTSVNVLKSYNEKTDTYVISNADSTIKNLKAGDTFYLPTGNENSEYIIVTVKSISKSGSTVTIVSDEETVEDVFECIKIDSTGGLTDEAIANAELGSALTPIDEEPVLNTQSDVDIDSGDFSKSLGAAIHYTAAEDGGTEIQINGELSLTITLGIKIYYDAKLFKKDYFEYRFSHEETLTLNGTATGKIAVDKEEAKIGFDDIPIYGTPITASINIYPEIELSVSMELSVSCTNTFVQTYNPYDGQREIQEKDKDWDVDLNGKFEAKFGFGISIEFKAVKFISLELSASAGLKVSGEEDGYVKCILDKYHYCDKCIDGEINIYADINITLSLTITKKLKWDLIDWKIVEIEFKLCDFYISTLNGIKRIGFTTCPNKMYKVDFRCTFDEFDTSMHLIASGPLENAIVKLNGGQADTNGDGKLDSNEVKTDKNGEASAYFKMGKYTVEATAAGYDTQTVTFTVDEDTPPMVMWFTKYNQDNPGDNPGGSIPEGTGSNDSVFTGTEATGTIIKFGSYPQAQITDSATISALDSINKTWISYDYYSGTGDWYDGKMKSSDYMKYADISYNGSKYRAVTFSSYRPWYTGYTSYATYNAYTTNSEQYVNGYHPGNVYYFKYEPLEWRVLDASEGLVMCNSAIDSQPFNNYVIYANGEYYGNYSKSYYASDYGNSSIRKWLNDDFYNTAFGDEQQLKIKKNQTIDAKSIYSDKYDGITTSDNNVFLLSYDDVLNTKYGFSTDCSARDRERQITPTDYALCQGSSIYSYSQPIYGGISSWMLRSSYDSVNYPVVNSYGDVENYTEVNMTETSIVPAIKLEKSNFSNSDDTGSNDSVFTGTEATGTIINFGSYPQSRVNDTVLINKLDDVPKSWKSYGYYSGTGSWSDGNMTAKDYMKYYDIDKNKDGKNDYRAVKFTSYRPFCTGYKNTEGTYQDVNGYKTNTVYYFKYEPLKWRILDPDDGLIMCETAVDSQPYNNYFKYADGEYWGDSSQTYYASNWEHSSIRKWLNEDFYNTAFNSSQKSRIKSTNLENKSTYNSKYDSANTTDKVFLLSYWDVLNSNYGFSSSSSAYDTARQLKSTDYAKCQGCYQKTSTSYYGNSRWRLRSPYYSYNAAFVGYDGGAYYYDNYVNFTYYGIVPALKISNLESIITSSVGSEEIVIEEDEPEILTTQSVAEVSNIAVSFRAGTANFSGISGNRYMLYSVKNFFDTLNIGSDNLLYINQATADNGIAEMDFYKNDGAVTVIVGDFGNGIETRKAEITNVYTAKLMLDGKLYKEIEYNEGQKSISLPPVPEKTGYTGAWESYSLTNGGTAINAIYTPIVKGKVQSVSVGNISVALNSTAKLNPVIKADSGVKYTVAYKSSDTKTATVDSNGNVKGIKAGKATITCTVTDEYGNVVSATCTVTVTNTAKVKSVSLGGDFSLNYKKSAKFNPVIDADSGVKYTVEYKSSNPKVATVDSNGNVKGVKDWSKKTATITCTVTDEYGNQVSDTCNVKVGYAWWQWIIGIVLFGWIWY